MFDYKNINTDIAEKYTDSELLKHIQCLDLVPGWGLIAELCKRFDKPQSDLERFIELYKSVGIELEPMLWDTNSGEQYLEDGLLNFNSVVPNYNNPVKFQLRFDRDGKFIQQGIWE